MKVKSLIATSVLAASAVASSVAMAEHEFSGNVGLTSNYIWRGFTQSADISAISGGIDYGYKGFYAGTWLSSLESSNYEQDWYAGYGFDLGPTSWDIGYIMYTYPIDNTDPAPELDFSEVYVNFGWQWLSAGAAYTVDKEDASVTDDKDLYLYASADFEVKGVGLGVLIGNYDFDGGSAGDYTHYKLSLSKDDFVFALEKNDAEPSEYYLGVDDPRFTVSWSKSFDF